MHAPAGRAIHWMMMVSVVLALGCRGANPFGKSVQITKSTSHGLPEIEAPPQRLATARTRSTDEPTSPHRAASRASTQPENTRETGVSVSLASGNPANPVSPVSQSGSTNVVSTTSTARATPTGQSGMLAIPSSSEQPSIASAKISDEVMPDDLAEMLQDFQPELRQQALRQFVAVAARSAGETNQPNTPESELAKTMGHLPALPEPKSEAPSVPPTRIAADGAPAAVSVTDATPTGPANASSPPLTALTDLQTEELESSQSDSASPQAGIRDVIASEPGAVAKQASDQELFAELINRLSNSAPEESETDRNSRLIKLRHLMVLSGDPDAAVAKIDGMVEAEQEYLRHQLLGLWTMLDPQGHPVSSRRFTSAIPQIREAAKFAAAATDALEVRSLAFCTEIESYGQITTFPSNRFQPGQQVILYCEIENFTAKRIEAGYETHLQGSYDVFNAKNEKLFSQVLPADLQVSANFLRDYFIAYQMYLPREIAPGNYRLHLTMEDPNGKKYGQANIPFEIAK